LLTLKLVEALVLKIWGQDIARIEHLLRLAHGKCGWRRQLIDGGSKRLSILVSAKSEADLPVEILNIFDLALLWLIISLNRASNHLLISQSLLNYHILILQAPSSWWMLEGLSSSHQSFVHAFFGSRHLSRDYLVRHCGKLNQILAR
jgi:hypothetical protein